MAIKWLGLSDFLAQQAAAVQASANAAVDFSQGSVMRALAQSCAGVALWLQSEVIQALQRTRLSTSAGPDVDSFLADWGLGRTQAIAAVGSVTFSRFTALNQAIIPVGTVVSTGPGGQRYAVQPDPGNVYYSSASAAYILPAGGISITVPVEALTPGLSGNALPGTVTSFVTVVPGVDQVTNAQAMVGGDGSSSDVQARSMFSDYIRGLPRGTPAAIGYAVRTISPNASFSIAENTDTSGAYRPGYFVVTVDDGSGDPPQTLLNAVATQVQAYRAIGTFAVVTPPIVTTAVIVMSIAVDTGTDANAAIATVIKAVTAYINSLGVGVVLPFLKVAQIAFDSSPHITSVQHLSINGDVFDIDPGKFGVVKVGTISASPVS